MGQILVRLIEIPKIQLLRLRIADSSTKRSYTMTNLVWPMSCMLHTLLGIHSLELVDKVSQQQTHLSINETRLQLVTCSLESPRIARLVFLSLMHMAYNVRVEQQMVA